MNKLENLLLPTVILAMVIATFACGGDKPSLLFPRMAAVEIRCYSGGVLVYEAEKAYDLDTLTYSDIIKWKEPGGIHMQSSADCIAKLVAPVAP